MKRIILLALIATVIIASCVKDRTPPAIVTPPPVNTGSDTLIYYWDFNGVDSPGIMTPQTAIVTGASLSYSYRYDSAQFGSTVNGIGSDNVLTASSSALRVRNPAVPFIMSLPTTGYKNIVLKYAEARTSKGSAINYVSYSTDGSTYKTTALTATSYGVDSVDGTNQYALISFDFSSDAAVNNNANFKFKITFSDTASTNTSGNDRFDNITLYGVKN